SFQPKSANSVSAIGTTSPSSASDEDDSHEEEKRSGGSDGQPDNSVAQSGPQQTHGGPPSSNQGGQTREADVVSHADNVVASQASESQPVSNLDCQAADLCSRGQQ